MSFFERFKEKAADVAQTGVTKSVQLAEIGKLKVSNVAEEDVIKKAYLEIGKLYYAEHGTTATGGYIAACEKIAAAFATIEENNARIAQLKTDESAVSTDEVVENVIESVKDTAEKVADKVEDVAEKVVDKVEDAVEGAQDWFKQQ